MHGRTFHAILLGLLLGPSLGWSQCPNPPCASGTPLEGQVFVDWQVFGRVTTLDGAPVAGALVRVDPNAGLQKVTTVETDLQGRYRTDASLDAALYPTLTVNVVARKPGYDDARETAAFKKTGQVWEIDLVLRSKKEDPEKLSEANLIARLAPRLTNPAILNSAKVSARKDYARGIEEFLTRGNAPRAVPVLAKVMKRVPQCFECGTLLALAELRSGSIESAISQLAETVKNDEQAPPTARRPEPLLALGVIETWKDNEPQAEAFLSQALRIAPGDPLVLEELGRAFLLGQHPEAAEDYLDRAIKAGAPADARLLRARVSIEAGDVDAASEAMRGYLAGRDVRRMSESVRQIYGELQDRRQLESYHGAQSFVDQPLPELIRAVPELRGIEPATNQEDTSVILRRVGENVAEAFQSFPDTVSTERIQQTILRSNGKVSGSLDQKFHYLILAESHKEDLDLREFRTDLRGERAQPAGLGEGFMITSGFASADLIFHPTYQSDTNFRYLGRQMLDGRPALVMAFAQKPSTSRLFERFNSGQVSVLILVQGLAWIDPQTYHILRLRTDLLKPAREIRLNVQTTEIQFDEVRFKGVPAVFWLPSQVVVTVEWKGKSFRNVHQYSDFMLFNVKADEKRKVARVEPAKGRYCESA